MTLNKAIFYRKEKRKPYRKAKAFDRTCRNHGSCFYCYSNRTYHNIKRILSAKEEVEEFYKGE